MTPNMGRRNLLILAGAAATIKSAQAAEPIRICAVNPYTGPMALYGEETTRGYELAAAEANAADGVLGRPIQIVRADAGTPQQGIAAAGQYGGSVDAFIGTYLSAVSNAASDAALSINKLYWDTNALALELTDRGLPNFVRTGMYALTFGAAAETIISKVVAPALKRDPTQLTVWIENEDSIFGTSIGRNAAEQLKAAGIKVVGSGAHSARAIDMNDAVLRIKRADADVLLSVCYVPDGNLLLRTMRDSGYKPRARVVLATGDTVETLEAVGAEALDGVLVASYPRWDMQESFAPGVGKYVALYKKQFNAAPFAPQGMSGYVGAQILFEAIQAAGSTDMEAVRNAAAKIDKPLHSYATGWGVKFDDKMQNQRAIPVVVQWQGKSAVTVYPSEAKLDGVTLHPL
jgi:branched-chain amino acid transport system substrate-binding protein